MKKVIFTAVSIMCLCAMAICAPVYGGLQANAASQSAITSENDYSNARAPYVTEEMCTPKYWLAKQTNAGKVLLKYDEITKLNQEIMNTPQTKMYTLTAIEESFDGQALVNSLSSFASPKGLYLNGKPVPELYYENIRKNIKNAAVTKNMKLRYGVAVNQTLMKEYPYEDYLLDDLQDEEWDQFVNTSVFVNEPVVIYMLTADGKFAYVKSETYAGWVPFADIAICKDKQEWINAFKMDKFLVVIGEKIYLEASAVDKEISEKKLLMGTVLPLYTTYKGNVTSRSTWNNYVVKLPARGKDGSFYQKDALIPANRDVSVGYLPLTQENIANQAFKLLGNRYGWGGMLNSQDCSQFVRDIYLCFGLNLPRDVSGQQNIPVKKYDLSTLSVKEKNAVMDSLPLGAIVQLPGHEVMYLGKADGRYFTINDSGSLISPQDEKAGVIRIRSVIINDLSVMRKNGNIWYDDLNYVMIPWEKQ